MSVPLNCVLQLVPSAFSCEEKVAEDYEVKDEEREMKRKERERKREEEREKKKERRRRREREREKERNGQIAGIKERK